MTEAKKTEEKAPASAMTLLDPGGRLENFKKVLWNSRAQWATALPEYLTEKRMFAVAVNCLTRTPRLLECDAASLFRCIAQCAELGLEPGGALGQAYLVPFLKEAQLIIGYRGYLELARRSGVLLQAETHIVYSKDKFTIEYGLDPKLAHSPHLGSDRGAPVAVYFIGRLANGEKHVEIMPWDEIQKIKTRALARTPKSPWGEPDFEPEMARKTVIRRAAKYLPLDGKLRDALEHEDELGEVVTTTAKLVEAPPASLPENSGAALAAAAVDAAISAQGLTEAEKAAILAEEAKQAQPKQEKKS